MKTYTIIGGVNGTGNHPGWVLELAEYLSNYESVHI